MNTPALAPNTSVQRKEITDVSSMLLPTAAAELLLPGVAVAEIVTFIPPEPDFDEEVPPWLLGSINWRNQTLCLVSYELMTGKGAPRISDHCRIAVLNNSGINHQLEFFAVLLQGTPRLLRLSASDVVVDEHASIEEGEKLRVKVSGEPAVIPDIPFIEQHIAAYLELAE